MIPETIQADEEEDEKAILDHADYDDLVTQKENVDEMDDEVPAILRRKVVRY